MNSFAILKFSGSSLDFRLYENGKCLRHTEFFDLEDSRKRNNVLNKLTKCGIHISSQEFSELVDVGGSYIDKFDI